MSNKNYNEDVDQGAEMEGIKYLCDIASKYPILSREEEVKLLTDAISDDPAIVAKAYEELVSRNLRLVIKKAKEFMGRGIPLSDLVQEGVTGLIRAIEKFDLSRGVKLSTYATRWIEQRVRRALENKSRIVKIPLNRLAQITALKKAYKKYIEDENRPPTSEEIAEILKISQAEAEELGRFDYPYISLNETTGEDDNLSLITYIVDEKPTCETLAENLEDKTYVHNLLSCLSKSDADFIKLRFGFLDNKERTAREMAQLLKCTTKEIKERESKILQILSDLSDYEKINYEV